MKVKKSVHPSVSLLRFTLGFGIFCTLCSSCAALGAMYPYGGLPQWLISMVNDLQQEGVLSLDGTGFAFAFIGFSIISILSLLAFVIALVAYRNHEAGKKPMMWALLLFGVAVLVAVGSLMITRYSCYEAQGGSDDTLYCTLSLPSGMLPPLPRP